MTRDPDQAADAALPGIEMTSGLQQDHDIDLHRVPDHAAAPTKRQSGPVAAIPVAMPVPAVVSMPAMVPPVPAVVVPVPAVMTMPAMMVMPAPVHVRRDGFGSLFRS